jgi:DNA processing protein
MLLARQLEWRGITPKDDEYPRQLKQLTDAPDKVWVAGRNLAELPVCVAIVGTRRPNGYGLQIARRLAADLAQLGACVVSGMALGIDAEAHRGALDVGGVTVAVLGSGVDVCQPVTNADLYRAILRTGAIVSEQEPGTPGYAANFVPRNRIIAGLSAGVVIVQAPSEQNGKRSGALVTAHRALDANREVFAVPGQVDWSVSGGPHDLIRQGQAHICTGAGDVALGLGNRLHWTPAVEDRPMPANLSEPERRILEFLSSGAATMESVCAATGLDALATIRGLGALEIAGFVGPAPGGRLRRIR